MSEPVPVYVLAMSGSETPDYSGWQLSATGLYSQGLLPPPSLQQNWNLPLSPLVPSGGRVLSRAPAWSKVEQQMANLWVRRVEEEL